MADPGRLGPAVRAAIEAPGNAVYVSAASAWEIAIKRALGRLEFPLERFDAVLEAAGLEHLPIRAAHAIAAGSLPRHHGDPFDRILVAQALLEGLVLVSGDAAVAAYEVTVTRARHGEALVHKSRPVASARPGPGV